MDKVNEFVKKKFQDGAFQKDRWVHEECAKAIVTYTDSKTGFGYKYFEDEDLSGNPALVQVSDLRQEGWDNSLPPKVVDSATQTVLD